jgi:pheromone shutdown-related protein TraB
MKQFNNIYIIGTSHVAKESILRVKENFSKINPDIIALELDRNRVYALEHNIKRPKNFDLLKQLGLNGFLFFLFGEFIQTKIGKVVKIDPGAEMKEALDLAKNNQKKIALIDREINITLKRFSKYFKKREIINILIDTIKNPLKNQTKFDLTTIPSDELVSIIVNHAKTRYPSLFKILIDERDKFMANKLTVISKNHPEDKILAVVGAGHVNGMLTYLKENFI